MMSLILPSARRPICCPPLRLGVNGYGKEKLEGSCYKEAHATFVPINFETGVANFAKKIVETIHVAAAGGE
jgi:hypothetical protein